MPDNKDDFSILSRFNLPYPPVGVKFSPVPPDNLARLDKKLALCEMLREAQEGNSFYADTENHVCEAGSYVLGQGKIKESFLNGRYGAGLKIFSGTRAASRLYQHIPILNPGLVNYLCFSPIEQVDFKPDLIIMITDIEQTEIILRASSYDTGQIWTSKYTPAIGCAWTYIYPYKTGKLNYSITGLGHGMKRRKLYPEGKQIISIPSDLFPLIFSALREMEWELPAYKPDGNKFVKKLIESM
ncbi:DUF169 domain-containing protein [Thermodesulfobacteriota bacterium]